MHDLIGDPFYTYQAEAREPDDTYRDFEGDPPRVNVNLSGTIYQLRVARISPLLHGFDEIIGNELLHYYDHYFYPPAVGQEATVWTEALFKNQGFNGYRINDQHFEYANGAAAGVVQNYINKFVYSWCATILGNNNLHSLGGGAGYAAHAFGGDNLLLLMNSPVFDGGDAFQIFVPPAVGGNLYDAADTHGNAQGNACTADTQFSQFNVNLEDNGNPHFAGDNGSVTRFLGKLIRLVKQRFLPGVRVGRGMQTMCTMGSYEAQFSTDIDVLEPAKAEVRCAGVADLRFKENLLLPLGASHYLPEKIFKPVADFPPLVQDYDLNLVVSKTNRYRSFSSEVDGCILELVPQSGYTLDTYSRNVFNQSEKSLQTIEESVPKLLKIQKTFDYDATGVYKLDFNTSEDRPDKVFIYIERESGLDETFDDRNPCVAGIDLQVMGQTIESVACLDEFQLYEACRRNAAIRCDLLELRKRTGGVLLSLDEVCDWTDFEFLRRGIDTFKGTFVIREDQIRKLDTTVVDGVYPEERVLLDAQARRITILFIYENWCLTGQAGTMRYYNKKLTSSALHYV